MLIPSLYATSLRTRSLRPVRVPSDHNTRWRLPFHFFPLIRDKNSLSPHIYQIHTPLSVEDDRRDAAHVRQESKIQKDRFQVQIVAIIEK